MMSFFFSEHGLQMGEDQNQPDKLIQQLECDGVIRRHASMSIINPDNAITHESSEHILSYHLKTKENRSSCPDFESILHSVSAGPNDIVMVKDDVEKEQKQDSYTLALEELSDKVQTIMGLLEKEQYEKNSTLKALIDYLKQSGTCVESFPANQEQSITEEADCLNAEEIIMPETNLLPDENPRRPFVKDLQTSRDNFQSACEESEGPNPKSESPLLKPDLIYTDGHKVHTNDEERPKEPFITQIKVKKLVNAIENREKPADILDDEEVAEILNTGKRKISKLLNVGEPSISEDNFGVTKFNVSDNWDTGFDDNSKFEVANQETFISRSFSESNLKKEVKFSISTDDLDDDQVLSLFIDGENINVTASSRTLATSNIDITSTESGFCFRLSSKQKSQSHANIPLGKSFSEENITIRNDNKSQSMEKLPEYPNEEENRDCQAVPCGLENETFQLTFNGSEVPVTLEVDADEPEKHVSFVVASSKDDFEDLGGGDETDSESANAMDDSFSISTVVENESWDDATPLFSKRPWDQQQITESEACEVQIDFEEKSISSSIQVDNFDDPDQVDNCNEPDQVDSCSLSSSSLDGRSSADEKVVRPKRRTILRTAPIAAHRRDIAGKVTSPNVHLTRLENGPTAGIVPWSFRALNIAPSRKNLC